MLGAIGTIGRATLRELLRRSHEVGALVHPGRGGDAALADATLREFPVTDLVGCPKQGLRYAAALSASSLATASFLPSFRSSAMAGNCEARGCVWPPSQL